MVYLIIGLEHEMCRDFIAVLLLKHEEPSRRTYSLKLRLPLLVFHAAVLLLFDIVPSFVGLNIIAVLRKLCVRV